MTDNPLETDTVVVGQILRPHGVHGEVVVEVLSDVPQRFAVGSELVLVQRGRARRHVRVGGSRRHQSRLLVRLEDCCDRNAALELRGAFLEIEEDHVPPPPRGCYYQFQLLDCRCRDGKLGDLGKVVELVEDGGGILLRVSQGKRELLVPFVEPFIRHIDLAGGVIELDLPLGLIETCESRS